MRCENELANAQREIEELKAEIVRHHRDFERWEAMASKGAEQIARLKELEEENARLKRDWPANNQVQGLSRAIDLLVQLEKVLGMTIWGRHLRYRLGEEPSYLQVLRFQLDALKKVIHYSYMLAEARIRDSYMTQGFLR